MIETQEGITIEDEAVQLYEIKLILKEMLDVFKKVHRNMPGPPAEGEYYGG